MLTKDLFVFSLIVVINAQKTPVHVYYESLCPDSQAFIAKQLHPTMKVLKDHVDLHLIPFGKSSFESLENDAIFTCHHGPDECYGNKIHACAIKQLQSDARESLTIDYIKCLMTDYVRHQPYTAFAHQCAEDVQVGDYESIEACANSTEGSLLLRQMGEITNSFQEPLKSVPTITIGNFFDADVQQMATKDFCGTLCSKLPSPPAECSALKTTTTQSSDIMKLFRFNIDKYPKYHGSNYAEESTVKVYIQHS